MAGNLRVSFLVGAAHKHGCFLKATQAACGMERKPSLWKRFQEVSREAGYEIQKSTTVSVSRRMQPPSKKWCLGPLLLPYWVLEYPVHGPHYPGDDF